MMDFEDIQNYWEGRAAGDDSVQSTTQDVFLREIELRAIIERARNYIPQQIADIGCGDGRTTIALANAIGNSKVVGYDYSASMIKNAQKVLRSQNGANVSFKQHDISDKLLGPFDFIYTTRCLINLPSWELQKQAIRNIHDALSPNGVYLMIENFEEGQRNFNQIRKEFDLPEIKIRSHNKFFSRQRLLDYTNGMFHLNEETNISSTYYLVSRVIYSRVCADSGIEPDYFDDHHRYAANLPFCGEYGPVRLMLFEKKVEAIS